MTGGYITHDGGQSWRSFGLRTVIETFAYDPHDARVIYAGNAALWRSDDTGRSWRMVFPNPARKTVEHQNGDHADYSLTSEDPAYPRNMRISAIEVLPADSKSISVAFSTGEAGHPGCWSRATLVRASAANANFQPMRFCFSTTARRPVGNRRQGRVPPG